MSIAFADAFYFVALLNARDQIQALTGDHHFEQAGFVALLK
jgi:hypothetical protein